jgi:hypothetical protein
MRTILALHGLMVDDKKQRYETTLTAAFAHSKAVTRIVDINETLKARDGNFMVFSSLIN